MTSCRELCEWLVVSAFQAPTQRLEAGEGPAQCTVGAAFGFTCSHWGRTLKIRTEEEGGPTAELRARQAEHAEEP